MKFKVNSAGKENLIKLNSKNPIVIMKYWEYKVPLRPKNFKFINNPEIIYAMDSKANKIMILK